MQYLKNVRNANNGEIISHIALTIYSVTLAKTNIMLEDLQSKRLCYEFTAYTSFPVLKQIKVI